MISLIRDVLFPSAAAIGLLGAAAMDSAIADETVAKTAVVAVAPVATVATVAQVTPGPQRPSAANEALADEARPTSTERRCERTGRIGKFKITRCD